MRSNVEENHPDMFMVPVTVLASRSPGTDHRKSDEESDGVSVSVRMGKDEKSKPTVP